MGASFENEKVETFSVIHETYRVKKYDRSDQYINAKLATKDGFLEWYWQGTEVRDINVSMIGRLYRNEQGWYYVEVLFRGRNVEFVMTAPCVADKCRSSTRQSFRVQFLKTPHAKTNAIIT